MDKGIYLVQSKKNKLGHVPYILEEMEIENISETCYLVRLKNSSYSSWYLKKYFEDNYEIVENITKLYEKEKL